MNTRLTSLIASTLAILLTQCASRVHLNCAQSCAVKGFVCSGMDMGTARSSSFVPNAGPQGMGQTISASTNYEGYTCREPKNEEERAQTAKTSAEARQWIEQGEKEAKKNTWYLIGGTAAIIGLSFLIPTTDASGN